MKLLMLTRYGQRGASSRMRFYQYKSWLETAGIDVTVSPFFSDAYVAGLQQGRKTLWEVIAAYPHRMRALLKTQWFDLVWIEKEALPWLPTWLEHALLPKRIPMCWTTTMQFSIITISIAARLYVARLGESFAS